MRRENWQVVRVICWVSGAHLKLPYSVECVELSNERSRTVIQRWCRTRRLPAHTLFKQGATVTEEQLAAVALPTCPLPQPPPTRRRFRCHNQSGDQFGACNNRDRRRRLASSWQ